MSAFGVLAIFVVAFLLRQAIEETDRTTLLRQHELVSHGIQEQIARVSRDQESVVFWDDAVLMAQIADTEWLHENLGSWMYDYFGHDQTAVIAPDGKIVYAMIGGYEQLPSAAAKTIQRVERQVEAVRESLLKPDRLGTIVEREVIVINHRPAIVSMMPIVPHSERVRVEPGREFVFVSLQYFDQALIRKLRHEYLLAQARISVEDSLTADETSVPITQADGAPIAFLKWRPELPGKRILGAIMPAGIGGGLLMLLLIGVLTQYVHRSSAALEASEARATHLASHDTLTGLANRARFLEEIDRALAYGPYSRTSLLFLDLDRFKEVNDTLGHQAGDELIREFASRAAHHLRRSDSIARLGGDEFAVLLREIDDEDDVIAFCERILHSVTTPFRVAGAKATVGVSIGIADAAPGTDRSELLRRADIALYAAKRAGKNCYRAFSTDLDKMVKEHRLIEEELRVALGKRGRGLEVYYQPQIENGTGRVGGVEAVVRWQHPRLGAILPAVFIPVAEESGLISQLDEWVLRTACRDAREWGKLKLAVNVSPRSFQKAGLADRIIEIARAEAFDLDRLEVEVTEKVVLDQEGAVAAELRKLRAAGIRITLDDFGIGYASLRRLESLTVDKVKISRSFVQHLGQTVDSTAMVNAITELGHALGLSVTAQGVETEAQKDYLLAIGCDAVQGFLFTKPLPAWAVAGRLDEASGGAPISGTVS